MSRLILPAAVWERELPEPAPCKYCGTPGNFTYSMDLSDPTADPYCSVDHWGAYADEHATLTGTMRPPDATREAPFQDLAWREILARWPLLGPPGITFAERSGVDVLLYRLPTGRLAGALSHAANGAINVMVDPTKRGQGIGRALVRAAARRWQLDLSVQRMTPAGYRLVTHIDPRRDPT